MLPTTLVTSTPVTHGACLRSFTTAGMALTETRHARGVCLERHAHRHACINLVLEGLYDERIEGLEREHAPLGMVFKPALAEHGNRFERAGARCLLIEILDVELAPVGADLRSPAASRDPRAALLGLALWNALAEDPEPLLVESLAAELYQRVRGRERPALAEARSPRLRAALSALHDDPRAPWVLSSLAAEVGLHPSHLARAFRARHGVSVGEYLRDLRLAAAALRLARTDEPIASLATDLGFSDQSHLTRVFRRRLGRTPGAFRRALSGDEHDTGRGHGQGARPGTRTTWPA